MKPRTFIAILLACQTAISAAAGSDDTPRVADVPAPSYKAIVDQRLREAIAATSQLPEKRPGAGILTFEATGRKTTDIATVHHLDHATGELEP